MGRKSCQEARRLPSLRRLRHPHGILSHPDARGQLLLGRLKAATSRNRLETTSFLKDFCHHCPKLLVAAVQECPVSLGPFSITLLPSLKAALRAVAGRHGTVAAIQDALAQRPRTLEFALRPPFEG